MHPSRSIYAPRVAPSQGNPDMARRSTRSPRATPSMPNRGSGWIEAATSLVCVTIFLSGMGRSQPPESASPTQQLEQQQRQLAIQYSKLEEMFIRMSELEANSNPTRAGLLMQAAQLSKQLATQQRMAQASDLLGKGQFSRAIPELESSRDNLKKLLELLQSENRSSRIKDERKRLEDVLKDVRRIENIQRATRGRTEAGQDRQAAADDQRDLEKQLAQSESDLKPEEPAEDPSKNDPSNGKQDNRKESQSDGNKAENERTDAPPQKNPSTPDASRSPNADRKPSPDGLKTNSENSSETPKTQPSNPSLSEETTPDGNKPSGQKASSEKPDDATTKGSEDPNDANRPKNPADAKNNNDNADSDPKKPNSEDSPTSGNSKPNQAQPDDSQRSPDPKKSSDQRDSTDSPNRDSQPQNSNAPDESQQDAESEDAESQASDGKPSSREEQARKRVQKARQRMKRAENKLREDKRNEAVQEQQKAEEELQKAIAELERILTQLREEEIERALVDLETRLKRMYEWEKSIRDQTEKLASLTGDDRDRQLEIQSNKLSIEQMKVVMEGQRAMLLLQDEGSSQAFPEALEQVNRDAQSVVKRLASADVSASTQSVEDEILGALEEMIDALQQVQKKREEEKQQQQQQGGGPSNGGGQQEQPLVDKLSELRLIKTLQLRVNRRTDRLANESNSSNDLIGEVGDPRLREELLELSTRQQKIQDVTREILLEKAKQ